MHKSHRLRRAGLALLVVILILAIAALVVRVIIIKSEQADKEQTEIIQSAKPDESEEGNFLADALKINEDTVAWLTIEDTEIDFPIVQSDDNEFYLTHGFDKSEYERGCPFLDYRNSSDFGDFNSIIYGHNWSNKYVFAPLLNFREQDYFDSHPSGTLVLPDEKCTIRFIACAVVENDSFIYSVSHPAESDRLLYLNELSECAVTSAEFEPESLVNARLVVLSTCSDDYDTARTVLVGYIEE